jgi:hypothetical protein
MGNDGLPGLLQSQLPHHDVWAAAAAASKPW